MNNATPPTHQLLREQDKSLTLCNAAGKRLKCPFQQPVMDVNNVTQQMVLRHKNCGNWCAFFTATTVDEQPAVMLQCVAVAPWFHVEHVEVADQQNGKFEIVR